MPQTRFQAALSSSQQSIPSRAIMIPKKKSRSSPRPSPPCCKICLDSSSSIKFYQFSCHNNHRYCIRCLRSYVDHSLSSGNTRLPCPEFQSCSSFISDKQLKDFLTSKSYQKYQDYKSFRKSKFCPFCQTTQNNEEMEGMLSQIACQECQKTYCLYHSNAHSPSMTCSEYESNLRETDAVSYHLIAKTSQKCPSCQFPTEKISGCNSMRCVNCKSVRVISTLLTF
jgi:hypothetical protein